MRVTPSVVLMLLLASASASAAYPSTRHSLHGGEVTTQEPIGSVSPRPYDGNSRVSWNARLGTVQVSGGSSGRLGWTTDSVSVTDDFEILGAPPGALVRVFARLTVRGHSGAGTLSDAFGRSVSGQHGPWGDAAQMGLSVDFIAGAAQRLTYRVSGLGGLCVDAAGTLEFSGLPSGMSIVSCRGYRFGQVAAPPVCWGGIPLYR